MGSVGPVRRLPAAITAIGLAVSLFAAGCQRTPDDAAIRAALDTMVRALEARDNSAFLAQVAPTYRDHEGRDFNGLRQLLLANLVQNRNIKVFLTGTVIEVHEGRADVRFEARLTSGEELLADRRYGAYRLHTLWQRDGRAWKVFHAEWQPLANAP